MELIGPFNQARGQPFQEERNEFGTRPGEINARGGNLAPSRDIAKRAISSYRGGVGGNLTQQQWQERIDRQQVNFILLTINYTTTPVNVLPAAGRTYFLLQNLDAAFNLFVNFGQQANQAASVGLRIAAGQAYEPYRVPQDDIWIAGSGSGLCTLLYATN